MGCNSCRSACEDCSEGGMTFRRSVRGVGGAVPAPNVVLTPADVRPSAETACQDLVDHASGVADLGSDPGASQSGVTQQPAPIPTFPQRGKGQQPSATGTPVGCWFCSLPRWGRAGVGVGFQTHQFESHPSDPNSTPHATDSQRAFPELGSDPNSAGHSGNTSNEFSASSPYSESAYSYLIDTDPSLDPINRLCTETRRIGVRAQFGDVSATDSTAVGQTGKTPSPGIRPQICYTAREFQAELKSLRDDDDAVVPLTPGAAA